MVILCYTIMYSKAQEGFCESFDLANPRAGWNES